MNTTDELYLAGGELYMYGLSLVHHLVIVYQGAFCFWTTLCPEEEEEYELRFQYEHFLG